MPDILHSVAVRSAIRLPKREREALHLAELDSPTFNLPCNTGAPPLQFNSLQERFNVGTYRLRSYQMILSSGADGSLKL